MHQGIYFPDGEQHMLGWMDTSGEIVDGKGTYQIKKLRKAVSYCKTFRTAVDIGAHVGTWTMQLAKRFEHVHSFEPLPGHRACFARNLDGVANVTLHPCALGDEFGSVKMMTVPSSTGSARIGVGDGADSATTNVFVRVDGEVPLRTLDSMNLTDVSFIKLDCEGYEFHALRGGEATIQRDLPVIIVEQKPGRAQRFGLLETGAVTYLQSLGYRQAEVLSGDYIMVPA